MRRTMTKGRGTPGTRTRSQHRLQRRWAGARGSSGVPNKRRFGSTTCQWINVFSSGCLITIGRYRPCGRMLAMTFADNWAR